MLQSNNTDILVITDTQTDVHFWRMQDETDTPAHLDTYTSTLFWGTAHATSATLSSVSTKLAWGDACTGRASAARWGGVMYTNTFASAMHVDMSFIYAQICMCVCMYIFVYVCAHACMHECMLVCVWEYICIHIHTHTTHKSSCICASWVYMSGLRNRTWTQTTQHRPWLSHHADELMRMYVRACLSTCPHDMHFSLDLPLRSRSYTHRLHTHKERKCSQHDDYFWNTRDNTRARTHTHTHTHTHTKKNIHAYTYIHEEQYTCISRCI